METEHFLINYTKLLDGPPWKAYALPSVVSIICFFTLYLVADDHLNRSLEVLALKCKMSPAMAGLTLLAFGNGASDFFTALIGAAESPTMILGGSLGAGLFITVLVLGCTLMFAQHKPVKILDGTADPNGKGVKVEKGAFLRSASLYLMCTLVVMYFGYERQIHLWQTIALISLFVVYIAVAVIVHLRSGRRHQDNQDEEDKRVNVNHIVELESILDEWEAENPLFRLVAVLKRQAAINCTSAKTAINSLLRLPVNLVLRWTIPPLKEEYESADQEAIGRFEQHHRNYVAPIGFIFLLLLTLDHTNSLSGLTAFIIFDLGLVWSFINKRMCPKWRQEYPPSILNVIGAFCSSLLWIYISTKELLAALTFLGTISGIDEAVLGMTILAWGNSCGDLVSNLALAVNGNAETAVIASLSGPIQNVLLTLGVSFALACMKSENMMVQFEAPDTAFYITGGCLVGVLILLLVTVPFVFKYRIPKGVGVGLAGGYCVFMGASLARIIVYKK